VNAAQSIEVRGTITLSTDSDDDIVWIEIVDTNKGMSEAVRRRISEPFYTTKAVGQGSGLGLSISWEIIVEKHRARSMSAASQGAERISVSSYRSPRRRSHQITGQRSAALSCLLTRAPRQGRAPVGMRSARTSTLLGTRKKPAQGRFFVFL